MFSPSFVTRTIGSTQFIVRNSISLIIFSGKIPRKGSKCFAGRYQMPHSNITFMLYIIFLGPAMKLSFLSSHRRAMYNSHIVNLATYVSSKSTDQRIFRKVIPGQTIHCPRKFINAPFGRIPPYQRRWTSHTSWWQRLSSIVHFGT